MNQEDLAALVRARLAVLQPLALELHDDSVLHASHAGHGGAAHFRLTLVSSQFSGKSQIMRHRAVYQALQDLIPAHIHALSIIARAPDEQATTPSP